MFIAFDTNSLYVRSSEDYIGNPNKMPSHPVPDDRDMGDSAQKKMSSGKLSTTKKDGIESKFEEEDSELD